METHCTSCHRVGGVGPFPLENYLEVKEYSEMISKVVTEGIMPPWFASSPTKGHPTPWVNDPSLPIQDKK